MRKDGTGRGRRKMEADRPVVERIAGGLRAVLLVGLAAVAPGVGAQETAGQGSLPVRLGDLPADPVFVGQQVAFYLTVLLDGQPEASPRFAVPEAPGGILLQISTQPVYGNVSEGGVDYTSWSYQFAFYPHRAGRHVLPPIGARARVGGEWRAGSSDAGQVEARLPPGAEGLSTLVTTRGLRAVERWDPQPGEEAKVGDAFERTIELEARDVLGMGFPPLPLVAPEGVSLYPQGPVVRDRAERGDYLGTRIETVVYVLGKEGTVTLPGLVYPWYDLDSGRLERIEFPARTLRVAADPLLAAHAAASAGPESGLSAGRFLAALAFIVALLVAAGRLAVRHGPAIESGWQARRRRRQHEESFLFRELRRAAENDDALAVVQLSPGWLRSLPPPASELSLGGFLRRFAGEEAGRSAEDLQRHLFDPGPVVSRGWRGEPLARILGDARRQCLRQSRREGVSLPPLNPRPGNGRPERGGRARAWGSSVP